ncbi:hypothetical protein NFI96_012153, partial [Prochilodus magdalenae]
SSFNRRPSRTNDIGWDDKCAAAFKALRKSLVPYILHVSVSREGLGSNLYQDLRLRSLQGLRFQPGGEEEPPWSQRKRSQK